MDLVCRCKMLDPLVSLLFQKNFGLEISIAFNGPSRIFSFFLFSISLSLFLLFSLSLSLSYSLGPASFKVLVVPVYLPLVGTTQKVKAIHSVPLPYRRPGSAAWRAQASRQ